MNVLLVLSNLMEAIAAVTGTLRQDITVSLERRSYARVTHAMFTEASMELRLDPSRTTPGDDIVINTQHGRVTIRPIDGRATRRHHPRRSRRHPRGRSDLRALAGWSEQEK